MSDPNFTGPDPGSPGPGEPTLPLSQRPTSPATAPGGLTGAGSRASLSHLPPGTLVSRYRIESVLGEGGMGTVYLARQEKPDREVALKVVRPGYATERMLRRFEMESEVLGRLLHPGIAQIYEAGVWTLEPPAAAGGPNNPTRPTHPPTSARGPTSGVVLPFFAMELVRGVSLTRYAQEKNLSTRERLELMAKICDAVQHAHQKGVIHRDLKPGNILVVDEMAEWQSGGVEQQGDGASGPARSGHHSATSPLRHLATSSSPQPKILDFGVARATDSDLQQTMERTDVGAIVGTIPYMSPEQVSGDPNELDTRSDVYALGVIAYELLVGRLPYDLERKMIHEAARIIREEEPTRLSSIDRALRGDVETIVGHALEKDKARRYGAASALAADIRRYLSDEPIAARPASTWYQLAKFSRRNKGLVGGVAAAFIFLSAGLGFALVSRAEAVRARDSEKSARESEAEQRKEAQSQRDAAVAARSAEEQQRKTAEAIAKFQTDMLASADPDKLLGDKVTVVQAMQAAVKVLDEGSLKDQPLVEAGVRDTIGNSLHGLARYDDAEPSLRRSLEISRAALPEGHPDIAIRLINLGALLKDQHRLAEAEPLIRQALTISRESLPAGHPDIAQGLNALALCLRDQNRLAEAEPLLREALEIRRAILPAGRADFARGLNNLATLLRDQNNITQAEPLVREALEIWRSMVPVPWLEVAAGATNLANLLQDQDRLAEAEPLFREALAIYRSSLPLQHPRTAIASNNLALLLKEHDRLSEAEPLYREALGILRAAFPEGDPSIGNVLSNLAELLRTERRFAEAEPLYREALGICRAALPAGHPGIATPLNNLALLLRDQDKLAEAEPLLREALVICRAALPAGHPNTLSSLYNLAALLIKAGRPEEAAPLVEECVEGDTKTVGAAHKETRDAFALAVKLYDSWDKAEPGKGYDAKAAEWKAKLDAIAPPAAEAPPK